MRPAPICDWLSWRHRYSPNDPGVPIHGGRLVKWSADGELEYEVGTWDQIKCVSSDTSVRVRCDGHTLQFTGNPGRFGNRDNVTGVGVVEAFERSVEILARMFPGLKLAGVGSLFCEGTAGEYGTALTRLDLAANFETDNYPALMAVCGSRRIGQRLPQMGVWGPVWGYGSKRGNWTKAKLYDKAAEAEGRRSVSPGATLARFEVQLGSEFLKQKSISRLKDWTKDKDMAQIVYGRFADQVLRESVSVENWSEIPARLRGYAILWRDGVPLSSSVPALSSRYRIAAQLRKFGIDVSVPCNVLALTRQVRIVEVRPVNNLRVAA